jgi:lysophospholipase L1-like esterase
MKSLDMMFTAALLIGAFVLSSCSNEAPEGPALGLGGNTITKYVAIGDSYTAGYQSNSLYASAQYYSCARLISLQLQLAGAAVSSFEQPLYGDPGPADPLTTKASRYEIISLVGPVIGPRGLTPGAPQNLGLARPYDNLGIPGAVVFDLLDTTSFAAKAGPPRNNPYFQLVLRNKALGANVLSQAAALKPDLVTFWLGGNDVLGYAAGGGFSPSSPTSVGVFTALYGQAIDALLAALPNAKIVTADYGDVDALPYFTTLGPKISGLLPAGVTLRYQMHGETGLASGSTSLTEAAPPLITLLGSSYAPLLGQPTGKWYRDNRYPAIPPGIDTTKPFGLHPQNPWPDALVLDASEQAVVTTTVTAYNAAVAAKVGGNSRIALVDVNAFWNNLKDHGYMVGGQKFTTDYITGGMFSLDGFHPSSRGYALIANQFIKAMNQKWGMGVPYVDPSTIPPIQAPVSKPGDRGIPQIPYEAFQSFTNLLAADR